VENLELQISIEKEGADVDVDETSFAVLDMTLEGAAWNGKSLQLTNEISVELPPVKFTWVLKREDLHTSNDKVALPVYLNETRADFLVAVDLTKPSDVPTITWYQRGVALSAWKPDI